jgi:hypothetical protein
MFYYLSGYPVAENSSTSRFSGMRHSGVDDENLPATLEWIMRDALFGGPILTASSNLHSLHDKDQCSIHEKGALAF